MFNASVLWFKYLSCLFAMSVFKSKYERVSVDKKQTVAEIGKMLEKVMTHFGTRDLAKILEPLEQQTWSTAPRLGLMMQYLVVIREVLVFASNTIVCHTKLVRTIVASHEDRACVFASIPVNAECRILSGIIRVHLSKWRDIKKYSEKLEVLLSQAHCV